MTCPTCKGAVWVRCPECRGDGAVADPLPLFDALPDAADPEDVREARILMRLEAPV